MTHVQGIAASRIVHVVARLSLEAAVVGRVIDAPEANRRAEMVALRSVVVNYIENYFEASRVQSTNHVLEFSNLIACRTGRRKARIGRKKSDRIISPVVTKSALQKIPIIDRMMYRHQLD